MNERVWVVWECEHCGNRHLWKWAGDEVSRNRIYMHCEKCDKETPALLIKMGQRLWAAVPECK